MFAILPFCPGIPWFDLDLLLCFVADYDLNPARDVNRWRFQTRVKNGHTFIFFISSATA
jgi:hypothetical protein